MACRCDGPYPALTFAELGPLLTRVAVEHRGWEQLTEGAGGGDVGPVAVRRPGCSQGGHDDQVGDHR